MSVAKSWSDPFIIKWPINARYRIGTGAMLKCSLKYCTLMQGFILPTMKCGVTKRYNIYLQIDRKDPEREIHLYASGTIKI